MSHYRKFQKSALLDWVWSKPFDSAACPFISVNGSLHFSLPEQHFTLKRIPLKLAFFLRTGNIEDFFSTFLSPRQVFAAETRHKQMRLHRFSPLQVFVSEKEKWEFTHTEARFDRFILQDLRCTEGGFLISARPLHAFKSSRTIDYYRQISPFSSENMNSIGSSLLTLALSSLSRLIPRLTWCFLLLCYWRPRSWFCWVNWCFRKTTQTPGLFRQDFLSVL